MLAEALVDEWLNRQRFFTVRGVKDGVDEIDLLGVRQRDSGPEGWHVEVQVSFRPIGYICRLTDDLAKRLDKKPTSAWARPPEMIAECAKAWVSKKFEHPKKQTARERCWPGLRWGFLFVHGAVRDGAELGAIESLGIELVPFHKVLDGVCGGTRDGLPGAAGTDVAEIVAYYEKHRRGHAAG